MLLAVPQDPLSPRRVDEHFRPEAEAARSAGVSVTLVDHDALSRPGGATEGAARMSADADIVYRGWMLTSEQYTAFDAAVAARGGQMRTNEAKYRQAHELPGWYEALSAVTPESRWTVGGELDDFLRCCRDLGSGPAVLRDYTKSMKHYWHEAAFIPDVTAVDAARRIAARFLELREDSFSGGFVLRRFERFTSAEARTWWVDGRCALITAHPDTAADAPDSDMDLTEIAPLIAGLKLPFVSADLVRRADGVWRVVELGDGQVSDRPSTTAPDQLIAVLTSTAART